MANCVEPLQINPAFQDPRVREDMVRIQAWADAMTTKLCDLEERLEQVELEVSGS